MTLRGRLLSLMLSMVGVVALTMTALNLNSLALTYLDVASQEFRIGGQTGAVVPPAASG